MVTAAFVRHPGPVARVDRPASHVTVLPQQPLGDMPGRNAVVSDGPTAVTTPARIRASWGRCPSAGVATSDEYIGKVDAGRTSSSWSEVER